MQLNVNIECDAKAFKIGKPCWKCGQDWATHFLNPIDWTKAPKNWLDIAQKELQHYA
jgi:hypothetical protein